MRASRRIDTAKAKAADGVLAVLTGADVVADKLGSLAPPMPEDMGGPKGFRTLRPILIADKVRAVGDRVAFVVAETLAQARNAAELIEIDYEPLPAVIDVEDAVKPGAPVVWDEAPNNVAFTLMMGNKEATDAAFASAKHVVTLKLNNTRITANSIEPRAAIGQYHPDSDSYTLYSTSQNPHGTRSHGRRPGAENSRDQAARDLARRRRRLRHEARRLSGGRAGGVGVAPRRRPAGEMGIDALGGAARRLARPRPGRHRRTGARRAAARFWGCASMRCTPWARTCSAPRWWCRCSRMRLAPGVYQIPAVHCVGKAVLTNTMPLAPYRGAGRPEATYLIEQLLDRAAQRHRHRSDRDQAAQFHSVVRHAAQDRRPASPMTAAISSMSWTSA